MWEQTKKLVRDKNFSLFWRAGSDEEDNFYNDGTSFEADDDHHAGVDDVAQNQIVAAASGRPDDALGESRHRHPVIKRLFFFVSDDTVDLSFRARARTRANARAKAWGPS